MKIYYHPASTTSRPLMLFASESGIKVDFQVVDLFTGLERALASPTGDTATAAPNRRVPRRAQPAADEI